MLKTLEEPPQYAIIILISNNESQMLNTIKSRCTKISFNPIKDSELKKYILEKTGKEIEDNILKLSEGSIGKAIFLKEKGNIYNDIYVFLNKIEQLPKALVFSEAESLYKNTEDIQEILNYINMYFFEKGKTDIRFLNCIKIVEETKKRLSANSNFNMTIDSFLMQIWEELNEKYSRR